jgi:pimeloyl-ACP methyl ester carboxylesterase
MVLSGYFRRLTPATLLAGLRPRRVGSAGLLAYEGGAGPSVVLLHGLGGAAANWAEVVPGLLPRYRVLALDLPGHGGSPPVPAATGLGSLVDAAAEAIRAAGAAPALVAGHSFGGLLAAELAARHSDLVRGLLLVAPAGIRTHRRGPRLVVRAATIVRPGRFVAPLSPRLARRVWFRRAVFRPFFVSDPAAFPARAMHSFLVEMRSHVDTRTAGRAMVARDARLELQPLGVPSLVLWGARDPQLPLEDGFEYARRLGARLRVVADCGHLVIGERPNGVVDALDALAGAAR